MLAWLVAAQLIASRPDPGLTPGATMQVSLAQICRPGYSKSVRNVPASLKRHVFARYGIPPSGAFEVDHLVSLELGGSNAIENLWPESYLTTPYNAHVKDALENRLHWLACHAGLPLAEAQTAIRMDWIAAYQRFVVPGATR